MPHHAEAAAAEAGTPRLRLVRPPWEPGPGDRWIPVGDLAAAARWLRQNGAARVLLTIGGQDLSPFAAMPDTHFVVRSIEPVASMPLVDATAVLDRGPFAVDAEIELLREEAIDTVVTRNSGGSATQAKLTAARRLTLPVVMVERPPGPGGPCVGTVADAVRWLDLLPS